MPKTRLQIVNSVLSLVGESQLLSTTGTLGTLVVNSLNTAIVNVVLETRSQVFESLLTGTVTDEDYLVSALSIPASVVQVFSVHLRIPTGASTGDTLFQIENQPIENLPNTPSYSVVGSNLFVSPMLKRPFDLRVHVLTIPTLPTPDAADSGLTDVVIPAVEHTAASILALSYLDDANQASIQQNIADRLVNKLKLNYGTVRGRTYNMGGSKAPYFY